MQSSSWPQFSNSTAVYAEWLNVIVTVATFTNDPLTLV